MMITRIDVTCISVPIDELYHGNMQHWGDSFFPESHYMSWHTNLQTYTFDNRDWILWYQRMNKTKTCITGRNIQFKGKTVNDISWHNIHFIAYPQGHAAFQPFFYSRLVMKYRFNVIQILNVHYFGVALEHVWWHAVICTGRKPGEVKQR